MRRDSRRNVHGFHTGHCCIMNQRLPRGAKYEYLNVEYLPAYISDSRNAIIIPVSGKGLWATLYGYFAVDLTNYSTVKGITFYQHGETPGLGAEITKDWFKSSFIGCLQ